MTGKAPGFATQELCKLGTVSSSLRTPVSLTLKLGHEVCLPGCANKIRSGKYLLRGRCSESESYCYDFGKNTELVLTFTNCHCG